MTRNQRLYLIGSFALLVLLTNLTQQRLALSGMATVTTAAHPVGGTAPDRSTSRDAHPTGTPPDTHATGTPPDTHATPGRQAGAAPERAGPAASGTSSTGGEGEPTGDAGGGAVPAGSTPQAAVLLGAGPIGPTVLDPGKQAGPGQHDGDDVGPRRSSGAHPANGLGQQSTSLRDLAARCPAPAHSVLRRAPGTVRTVALTFDDGPSAYTPQVLTALHTEHVHATFFVIGRRVAADPATVAGAAAGGNLIGNHTWDHVYPRQLRHGWTVEYLQDQIGRTNTAVTSATGQPTCFFRPPGGFLPATVPAVGQQLRERVTLWSVDTRDWEVEGHGTGDAHATARMADRIYTTAIAGATQQHPVILLHDGGGYRGATVAALPRIIAFYRAHGYQFVRLDGQP